MGSLSYVPIREASKRLGINERTVYIHLRNGKLRGHVENGKLLGVLEEDVLTGQKIKAQVTDEAIPFALNKKTIMRLHMQVRMLQQQMSTVLRILGVRHEKLEATDSELINLYQTAEQYSREGWPPHVEELWASVFLRIRMETIEHLQEITGDSEPWRPFYRFASTLAAKPHNTELRETFLSGRENLYHIAYVLNEAKGRRPQVVDKLISRDASPIKKLLRHLDKARMRGEKLTNGQR